MRTMTGLLEQLDRQIATDELQDIIRRLPNQLNEFGYDDWGFSPETAIYGLAFSTWLYRRYFRVEAHGTGFLPEKRALLVANHSGQLPFDGMMIATASMLESNPPRLLRGMVERWFPTLPWISIFFFRCGQMVGNPHDCEKLLERDEAIMVFPEGVRGSGKTIWHRYELQTFPTGFLRLALRTDSPIIPVGVVGGEESCISVYDWKGLARLFGAPYLPIPALLPVLGVASILPMPTKFYLNFGEPLEFHADPDAPDAELRPMVEEVEESIRGLIARGREQRRGIFGHPTVDALIPRSWL